MAHIIHPQHLSLISLLDSRLFNIPDYQRSYSWTDVECSQLLNDIERLWEQSEQSDEASHFMATIVCLRRNTVRLGTDEMAKLDIVDGQQRLTTLVILFNAIRFALNKKDKEQKRSADKLKDLLIKPHDNLLLLQTNHDASHFFANYLRKNRAPNKRTAKTLADRNLLSAIANCREFVRNWIDEGRSLLDLVALIKNKLTFILHETSEEKTVYTVFEVINSRGMEVAQLDKLKSILMGKAFSLDEDETRKRLIDELHTIWRDIYSTIGLHSGLDIEALRFAATLALRTAPSKPLGAPKAVGILSDKAHDAESIREVAQSLLEITKTCYAVISNPRQQAVTHIRQARLLAVAIHSANLREKHDLLNNWEKVTFRIYGLHGEDARTRVGDYCRLAWDIANHKVTAITAREARNRVREIGAKFPVTEGIDKLRGKDCYDKWKEQLRYFLFRYEEYLARKSGQKVDNIQWERVWAKSADVSIEHIRPQSRAPADIKHTLGNLMLLPPQRNSSLGDRSPGDKANSYLQTGFLHAKEVADTLQRSPSWSKRTCKDRERRLLNWALDEWADS